MVGRHGYDTIGAKKATSILTKKPSYTNHFPEASEVVVVV